MKVPQVTLVNTSDFSHGMEVQISPQGRLMQPVPTVRFVNLLDDLQYAVWLSFVRECGQVAGNYMHPDSPLPGSYWNEKCVSFSRLKLFMYDGFNSTPVSLVCNKRYFLQINFGIVNDAGHILASTVIKQGLIGTWFVAVNCNRSSTSSKKQSLGATGLAKRCKTD
uniref:Putative t-box dna binding domain of the t-box family of transcriptional regulator n=2 Tax=Ornithodoros turicata TaxID=34597 RepID=A0A2R5LJV5_9ACAR